MNKRGGDAFLRGRIGEMTRHNGGRLEDESQRA